ncbi:hypothetical protein An02g04450 [Aspergillus niger]|uniref:Uncharacterized protein n=2 Tax=Aspergillus niger TaxID=5061 RepID=A2QCR2_ASPNC|nr:hypothetical protein An02g04450 [Aspergillus niger]CAK37584.1 hypothetical protein An02g04450 [Aspergillus niger]
MACNKVVRRTQSSVAGSDNVWVSFRSRWKNLGMIRQGEEKNSLREDDGAVKVTRSACRRGLDKELENMRPELLIPPAPRILCKRMGAETSNTRNAQMR